MHNNTAHHFESFDGTQLFYQAWEPDQDADKKPRKAIVFFHRGHEHSARLSHLAEELALTDFSFFAWDQRGHGKSPGERGYADHAMDFVRDVESFIRHLCLSHQLEPENLVVVAHSVSAVLAATWLKSYAPRIRGAVFVTPAFDVKLYVPFALPGIRVGKELYRRFTGKKLFIQSYVTGKVLTHDQKFAESYDSDPLISKQIAANILTDLFDLSKHIIADAGAIVTPVLLLSARADWVVKNLPQRNFFKRLSSQTKKVRVFRGMYHALLHEKDRALVLKEIEEFVQEIFAQDVSRTALANADRTGYTNEEYAWLNAGLPMISLKRVFYSLQKLSMRTLGCLSDGIKLGWDTGFDSGQSLDYIYRNVPSGKLGIGKLMDQGYLASVGWAGIRQRKKNMELLLKAAIANVQKQSPDPVRIADVAGGPGRYVLDVVREMPATGYKVLIRDWSDQGLEQGREIAKSLNLTGVEYRKGDAFSAESLSEIGTVDIAIVSGLYELFPDNQIVSGSLRGIADCVRKGGYLLYTGQPWHPQLEMIAEVLINRDKKPWIMRRRTQAEMDELVRSAGFSKLRMELDNWQIFTVSLAQRV